jgi:hypothetical protein
MGNSHHRFSDKIVLDFALIMAHGILHVPEQLFAVESPRGSEVSDQ